MSNSKIDIDYALVETTRPPIYTAMKYWGKKPHNIWSEYIKHYTPDDGIFLDPFCGSGISVFESVKLGRKTVGFDLNPLSSFLIEVLSSKYEKDAFKTAVETIIQKINKDKNYELIYKYGHEVIHHLKWKNSKPYEVGVIKTDNNKEEKVLRKPNKDDEDAITVSEAIDISKTNLYYPDEAFPNSPSFSASFISNIGGNNFSNIWTNRNLYVLALIFNEINTNFSDDLKKQLLFGFIQTVHLCTKMNIPREPKSNRPFSTSWGRSAYLCSGKFMEQNPLYVFEGSCFGKQSVESCLESAKEYLGEIKNLKKVSTSNTRKKDNSFSLKYGIVDVNAINNYIEDKSIDFVMTDPPYGGLVQYLDLSYLWLVWLKKYNPELKPDFSAEITIKKGVFDLNTYQARFTGALRKIHSILKDDGKLVLTFHNKDIQIWNAFISAIRNSGFVIEKSIHQQNMRSGESVVANPYGTSGTDFYIRCIKAKDNRENSNQFNISDVENSVLSAAIKVISERNEPTPYQILFNGILAHLSSSGYLIDNVDRNIESALKKFIGDVFVLTDNTSNTAGDYWWFTNPREFINFPDVPLSDRVELAVTSLLRRESSVTFDEVLREIFMTFPNGLTPDTKSVQKYLEKYATKSHGRWLYNSAHFEKEFTKHTEYLKKLSEIGKRLGQKVFIGKREQPEKINGITLSTLADITNLSSFELNPLQRMRLEMVDMIWYENTEKMNWIIEVENSTTITSAIQRASNAGMDTNRLIVIPDSREKELKAIRDKFFVDGFKEYGWKYMIYSDIDKVYSSKTNLNLFLKSID